MPWSVVANASLCNYWPFRVFRPSDLGQATVSEVVQIHHATVNISP
jgi:hypothetical protein